jgi:hypothetical protein
MKGKKKTKSSDEDPQLADISGKLDMLIRISSLGLIKDMKTQKEQIEALSDAGFQPKDIAGVLRTSRNTVNVTLNAIRKERAAVEAEGETEETPKTVPVEAPPPENKPEVKENAQES